MTEQAERYPWLAAQWAFFIQRLEQDRLPHALLIEGPEGTGKQHMGEAMTARLLCSEGQAQACGECRSCQLLQGGAHPDRFELSLEEDSSVIKIDQVRRLISALNLTTSVSTRKVACIQPADNMNAAAANALLKSLEEPNGDAVLILVSSDPGRLPVTIRSRCQSIKVATPDQQTSMNWLEDVTGKPRADIVVALAAAGGSPLRAEQFLASQTVTGYAQICTALVMLLTRPGAVSGVTSQLLELPPEDLWRWLSICSSEAARSTLTGQPANWLPADVRLQAVALLELQKQADANRQLTGTPLRKDLLLQEWLIKWALQKF